MAELSFKTTPAAALKNAQCALFLAPQRALRDGWLDRTVSAPWTRLVERAAAEVEAGPGGRVVSAQNPDEGPARVVLGVLPDRRSRHNCPARAESVAALVKSADLREARVAVIACAEEPEHAPAIASAVGRMLPLYSRTTNAKTRKPSKKQPHVRFVATDLDGVPVKLNKRSRLVVDRARWSARLVDMPAAEMHSSAFVRAARAAAKGIPHLTVSVISGNDLKQRGLRGLHAVGRTAIHGPRLLLLRYTPPKARRKVALIGKGILYDTGGLSLKPSVHMAGMKCDMGGAAAVVGATLALAEARHKDALICGAALAENAIGPDAYRPDDIIQMHSGRTVEINNTDAEGRLVLADALSYVARRYKPDVLIDMATLTGAALVATGLRHAAVISNRAGLETAAVEAGRTSGDLAFALPFAPEFYQGEFRSKVADMKNSVADRMNAQTSCAAQFIYSHIEDLDLPWLHVDMAGPAFREERATGYGVALVAALLDGLNGKQLAI